MKTPADIIITRVRELPLNWTSRRLEAPEEAHRLWMESVATCHGFEADKERLVVFALNAKLRLIAAHTVSIGSLNESIAHPREIFRPIVVLAAYGFILVHNYPSGDPTPSEADRRLTVRLAEGAKLLQIQMFDHVIVGNAEDGRRPFFSFKEAGML
jgi:DNA repair protein RadC